LHIELNSSLKIQAKRSSSETLLKRSAPDAEWNGLRNDNADLFSLMMEETLYRGNSIRFRAPGDSMYPTICDGDLIMIHPIKPSEVIVGDIILYRHENGVVAHRVVNIQISQSSVLSTQHSFLLRGDAAIVYDDPVRADQILGKVVSIERNVRRFDPYCLRNSLLYKARRLAARIKKLLF
jgi:signal peptidase